MTFINGEQRKDLLTHYRKTKIIKPITLTHNTLPACRFSASFETPIDEFSITDSSFARIRLRYTVQISDSWQLDISLVKNVDEFNNAAKLKSDKTKMFYEISASTFLDRAPWAVADIIEFELEYIGTNFSTASLADINPVFDFLNVTDSDNNSRESSTSTAPSGRTYQNIIHEIAKLIRPKDAHKFRQTEGLKQLSNQVIELDKGMFLKNVLPNITRYFITDKIDGSMLVFYNSNTNLKKYNSMESEQYTIGSETVTFNKKQIFDEIILDGKYMLVGVIMLEGVIPGQMDSGKHYFSIIRNSEGAYFKYDDMSPKILQFNDTAIPIVKNIIFNYQHTNRRSTIPVMYFYERIPTFYSPPTPAPVDVFIDYDDKDLTITYKDKKYPFDTKESLRRKLIQLYEHL
jgi:hypothetical protein